MCNIQEVENVIVKIHISLNGNSSEILLVFLLGSGFDVQDGISGEKEERRVVSLSK